MAKTPQLDSLCLSHKSPLQREIPAIHLPGQVMNSSAALCICTVQLKTEASALGCFPPQALHTPACSRCQDPFRERSGCSAAAQLLGRTQEMQINTMAPRSTQRFQPVPPHSPLEGSPRPVPSATASLDEPQAWPYVNAPSPGVQLGTAPSPHTQQGMSAAPAFVQSLLTTLNPN